MDRRPDASLTADLISYYDTDAARRATKGVGPDRSGWRSEFIELLRFEGRTSVVELGCGPGRDTGGFLAAGMALTGLDLSFEHARLATEGGMRAVQGSLFDLPFRPRSFEACWTMSTLVHVPDRTFDAAMTALSEVVTPGAPVGIGTWGGIDHEGHSALNTMEPRRFFSRRSHNRLRSMLAAHGDVLSFTTKTFDEPGWEYQFAILRTPS